MTGGTGFLGAALVRRLVTSGHSVRVLDNGFRGATRRLGEVVRKIEPLEADIRDAIAVRRAVKGVDCVVHLAFINGTEFFYSEPELVLDVGIRGMLNVVDACRAEKVRDLVVASSSEVYQTPPVIPTDESVQLSVPDILNPRYSYGGGKIASELIAINYGRRQFDRVAIFRPHNVYGPDMGWEHVLPQLILRLLDQVRAQPKGTLQFSIQGDGSQTRAFMHIDDFTEALIAVIDRGAHLNIYHIGNPEEISIAEVAHKLSDYFGREIELSSTPAPPGGTQRRCPDIQKLIGLGFRPRISLDEGLTSIADWYVANSHLRPQQPVEAS